MRRKPFHVFLLHAAFVLALLAVVPGTRDFYPRFIHAAGNALFGSMGEGLSIRFEWSNPDERADSADTRMVGREEGRLKYRWRAIYSSFNRGFWPSATLAALILAMPMSRRRRAAVLPGGLVLFNAFFLLQVAAFAWLLFQATAPAASPETWERPVSVGKALFNSPVTEYPVVFLIWAGLAQPTHGLDLDSLIEALRRIFGGAVRASPPTAPPSQSSEAPESGQDSSDSTP